MSFNKILQSVIDDGQTMLQAQELVQIGLLILRTAAIILLGIIIYKLLKRAITKLPKERETATRVYQVLQVGLRWILVIFVTLLVLQQLGVDVANLWTALSAGLVMLGVGLVAAWSVISNALCALLLILFRPFRIGDEIEIVEATGGSGLRGKVVGFDAFYTSLEEVRSSHGHSTENALIRVPNNVFFQKSIRRWRGMDTMGLTEFLFGKNSS